MRPCSIPLARTTLPAMLAAIGLASWSGANAAAEEVVTTFRETEESFANPGQGWMTTRRLPDDAGRLPYSVAY